jgi:thiosulfate dehydrogenase
MENSQKKEQDNEQLISVISKLLLIIIVLIMGIVSVPIIIYFSNKPNKVSKNTTSSTSSTLSANSSETVYWKAPDVETITDLKLKESISYGKELIAHTSKYLGPKGSVLQMSNGLNCQNCHLDAGTKVWGNNYGSVASLYPKFRARSGAIENIYKRINDCFQRSLNGIELEDPSTMMQKLNKIVRKMKY